MMKLKVTFIALQG